MPLPSNRVLRTAALAVVASCLCLTNSSRADDKPNVSEVKAASPSAKQFEGTWKWEFVSPNGERRETSVRFRVEGDRLTGSLSGFGAESPITNGVVEGDAIRFRVARVRNNRTNYSNYEGRLEGKVIRGKSEFSFGGETRKQDWEAMREADFANRPPNLNGLWKYTFPGHSGQTFEPVLKLKQDGDRVSGALQFNENETPVTEAKLEGRELWLKVVRERDGQRLTSIYQGKVEGNTIQGTIEADWSGVLRSYKWEARRQGR